MNNFQKLIVYLQNMPVWVVIILTFLCTLIFVYYFLKFYAVVLRWFRALRVHEEEEPDLTVIPVYIQTVLYCLDTNQLLSIELYHLFKAFNQHQNCLSYYAQSKHPQFEGVTREVLDPTPPSTFDAEVEESSSNSFPSNLHDLVVDEDSSY
ncbi:hypothetical protein [Candidatus Phytoplasma pini]|uniref:Uncharacterized protein n=1 Tax=Candidatus Phytoplasma pini TaxID=267362 RepID=A0A559KIY6_9MOLU|nr:hypothetical protein [Candidatus Phytoplasma pini]TVY12095.1 hypothetical protein MDPP_00360 [Candidatus Phytoplasma pini]